MECWGARFLDLMDEAWGPAKLGEGGRGSCTREARAHVRRLLDEAWGYLSLSLSNSAGRRAVS
jgi:hypothetical protein